MRDREKYVALPSLPSHSNTIHFPTCIMYPPMRASRVIALLAREMALQTFFVKKGRIEHTCPRARSRVQSACDTSEMRRWSDF